MNALQTRLVWNIRRVNIETWFSLALNHRHNDIVEKMIFYRIILMFTQCWLFVWHQSIKNVMPHVCMAVYLSTELGVNYFRVDFSSLFAGGEKKSLSEWIKNCKNHKTECAIKTNTTVLSVNEMEIVDLVLLGRRFELEKKNYRHSRKNFR